MFSFSFKFNLSNLKFYVLQFLVHLLSFVHLNMFYVVIFIHVSDHGATHLGLCPFKMHLLICALQLFSLWNNNARLHVCESWQSFRLAQPQQLLERCEFQTQRFFHQSWLLNVREV